MPDVETATSDTDVHRELAQRALREYGLTGYEPVFVRHNENLTYRAHDPAHTQDYLLRIHMPRNAAFIGAQQSRIAITSELAWLAALRRDTGIPLQQSLPDTHGQPVATIEHPAHGKPIQCTMLTWIEAGNFSQTDPRAPELAHKLGRLDAKLHAHARAWQPPAWYTRPVYDLPELDAGLRNLEQGCASGIIGEADFALAARAAEHIRHVLSTAERTRQTWGIAHTDLLGNLLVQDGELIPIDFSLSGFCYYLFDAGICLCNLKRPLRERWLAGYRAEAGGVDFTREQLLQIDAFIFMIIFIAAGRWVSSPEWREWFDRRFTLIARKYCPMLLQGEPFLMEI